MGSEFFFTIPTLRKEGGEPEIESTPAEPEMTASPHRDRLAKV